MLKTKKGFSLIELAVTLVVIGIISGIGVIAIIQSLAEQKRIMDIDQNLNRYTNAMIEKIGESPTQQMPNESKMMEVISDNFTSNFKYISKQSLVNKNVCNIASTGTSIIVCEDETCSVTNQKKVDNVLFALAELGGNNIYDSQQDNSPDNESIVINTFKKGYDDKIKFYTLSEAKKKLGCNIFKSSFRFLTEQLPSLNKNSSIGNKQIKIAVNPQDGVKEYYWCIVTDAFVQHATPNSIRFVINGTKRAPGVSCTDSTSYFRTTEPFIFLTTGGTNLSNMLQGTYGYTIKARYTNQERATVETSEFFSVTIR